MVDKIQQGKIQLGEQWYILATSSPTDERRRVLKHNETFALFDRFGDIQSIGLGEEGIYHGDTCFLSHQELLIDGVRPMHLNSTVKDDNGLFIIELMNPDLHPGGKNPIHKGDLHIFRAKLLWNNACHEHVRVANYGLEPVEMIVSIEFESDYKDIFEVRGFKRSRRGTTLPTQVGENEVTVAAIPGIGPDHPQDPHYLRSDASQIDIRSGGIHCLVTTERRGASVPDDRMRNRVRNQSRTGKSASAGARGLFRRLQLRYAGGCFPLAQSLQDRYLRSPFQ